MLRDALSGWEDEMRRMGTLLLAPRHGIDLDRADFEFGFWLGSRDVTRITGARQVMRYWRELSCGVYV